MKYSRSKYNKFLIGPGGWECCCRGPSKKYRKLYKRIIKHKETREEMKLEMEQTEEEL